MIGTVTFDLWDTIVIDDSDEPKRAAQGLPSKQDMRRSLFVEEVLSHHPEFTRMEVDAAFDHLNDWFRQCWKVDHHTPAIGDRLAKGLLHLNIEPTPGFDEVVAKFSTMEVEIPPDLTPGIAECLDHLAGKYRLGIVSDAIVTPGLNLRELLANHGLARYFEVFVFSDEAGASKPDRKVFDLALATLGGKPSELAHIGDREYNDITGPVAYGAHGILYTGAINRGTENTRATAVYDHHRHLPELLAAIGR